LDRVPFTTVDILPFVEWFRPADAFTGKSAIKSNE